MPDDRAGTEGRCPVCQQRLYVPEIIEADGVSLATTEREQRDDASGQAQLDESPVLPSALGTSALHPPPLLSEEVSLAVGEPPSAANAPIPPQPVRWFAWRRSDALSGYTIVRPTARQLEIVYWLACLLPFATAFCAAPALPHLSFSGAPLWAQLMLVAAMLELGYAACLGLVPDRSTIDVGMYLHAAIATAYVIALAVICFSSEMQLAALGVSGMRGAAATWCLLALVISAAGSAVCKLVVRQWRNQTTTQDRN